MMQPIYIAGNRKKPFFRQSKRRGKVSTAIVLSILSLPFFYSSPKIDEKQQMQETKTFATQTFEEAMIQVTTPNQVREYLLNFLDYQKDAKNFGETEYMASFRVIHQNRSDDCDGAALAAAALLHDNGYPPLMLCMYEDDSSNGHAVFVYNKEGEWATLGTHHNDCQKRKYDSVEDIVETYGYARYNLVNIKDKYNDWLYNDINMKKGLNQEDLAIRLE